MDAVKRDEQKTEIRLWKLIDILTAFLGRKEPLQPGDVFPLLKEIVLQDRDDSDDVDPRQAFQAIAQVMATGRGLNNMP